MCECGEGGECVLMIWCPSAFNKQPFIYRAQFLSNPVNIHENNGGEQKSMIMHRNQKWWREGFLVNVKHQKHKQVSRQTGSWAAATNKWSGRVGAYFLYVQILIRSQKAHEEHGLGDETSSRLPAELFLCKAQKKISIIHSKGYRWEETGVKQVSIKRWHLFCHLEGKGENP